MVVILIIAAGALTGVLLAKQLGKGSKGTEIKVPEIVGMKQDEAKKAVEDKGLKFVVVNIEKSDKEAGTVIECSPQEGMTVLKGSEVRVNISGGTTTSKIPDFKGMDINNALAYIDNNGLKEEK